MQKERDIYLMKRLTTATILLLASLMNATASGMGEERKYTKEHPLTIACHWDLPPFEFSSDKGEATGFNVDVTSRILDELEIPYKFIVMDRENMIKDFKEHRLGMIFSPVYKEATPDIISSRSIIGYYNIKAASLVNQRPVKSCAEMCDSNTLVVLENGNWTSNKRIIEQNPTMNVEYNSSREAMAGIANGSYQYFIWGEEPLKWKIKELSLENIVIHELNLPPYEVHFISYDPELMEKIDKKYAALEQSGDIDDLQNEWFHPERIKNSSNSSFVIAALTIFVFVIMSIFILNRLTLGRIKKALIQSKDLVNMMSQALSMGNYIVVVYDIKKNLLTNQRGKLIPSDGMTLEEFIERMTPDEQEFFRKEINEMIYKDNQSRPLRLKWNAGSKEHPQWRHLRGHSTIENDEHGLPKYVLNVVKDLTEETAKRYEDDRLRQHLQMVFNSSLIAMSFYDKDGMLIDTNEKMKSLCGLDDYKIEYFSNACMFDTPYLVGDFDRNSHDVFHVCQRMYFPNVGIDLYIEFRARPIIDSNGEIIYYTVSARDLGEERNMYLQQRQIELNLQEANKNIEHYEERLRYLLDKSDMYVWAYDANDTFIRYSRSLRDNENLLPVDEFINNVEGYEREKTRIHLSKIFEEPKKFNITRQYLSSRHPQVRWIAISAMPITDKTGKVVRYFGIARNITTLMETQEKLKKESARADESANLKSVFLANMTHEIRTPLNAIVGFADVLKMVDDTEERRSLIHIIRNNCDMLLRLINDIIEISNISQGLMAIEESNIDFAKVFNEICLSLEQRIQGKDIQLIFDNPYDTFPTRLDKGRMQQIITNFATNALKHTQRGHIKLGYRYENGGIYIYCEDTGTGIPKDKQALVFERFVKLNDFIQGTGLGLSICKSIAERCGGKIGVESEGEGCGSTFWIWIPCNNMNINK